MTERGRPTLYNQELADRICSLLVEGDNGKPTSLRSICRMDDMPGLTTVMRWLNDHDYFRAQYARARDEQAEAYADEIVEISDTEPDPQKARVRIDARKWAAGKAKPKKYGEASLLKLSDPDGNALPLTQILQSIDGRSTGLPGA